MITAALNWIWKSLTPSLADFERGSEPSEQDQRGIDYWRN